MSRESRLAARREAKFEALALDIREEPHTDIRTFGTGEHRQDVMFDFKYAVYSGRRLIGRTFTRRSALKRAHQECKNNDGSRRRRR